MVVGGLVCCFVFILLVVLCVGWWLVVVGGLVCFVGFLVAFCVFVGGRW